MVRKYIGTVLSFIAFAYTLWYMHFGVPYKNSGALSKIGLAHPVLFWIWGILTLFALSYNITVAYKKYTSAKVYIPLLCVSAIGMLLTLSFDFDYDKQPDYFLHCAGSLTFSAVMGVTVFLLFVLCFKKSKLFRMFTYLTAAILIVDLIFLLVYKETALIEVLPIFAGYLLLGIVNFREEKVEATR